jgi:hypothetical protein
MRIWPILVLAVAHFATSLASAFAAYGWDLDHVSSLSTLSQASEAVYKVLMFPHDALLHLLLSLHGWSAPVVVGTLVVSSVLWGSMLYALWCLLESATSFISRAA